jgi:hypothetical protein
MKIYNYESKKIRELAGRYHTVSKAVKNLKVSHDFYSYWRRKYLDPTFHSNSHGGKRWNKFSKEEVSLIRFLIWKKVRENPSLRLIFNFKILKYSN